MEDLSQNAKWDKLNQAQELTGANFRGDGDTSKKKQFELNGK